MKSRLFRSFDPQDVSDNRFGEDIALLLSLSTEQWQALVSALPALMQAQTLVEQKPVAKNLEATTGMPAVSLSRICKQARFFLSAFLSEETKHEDPSMWAEDLVSVDLIPVDQRDRFVSFLSIMKDQVLIQIETLQRMKLAEAGVFPAFKGAGTTVELRGIFKEDYKWGGPVDAYAPELEATTPIVSVAIKLDSGTPQTFVFQAASADLDYLINELTAAKKCADILQKTQKQNAANS